MSRGKATVEKLSVLRGYHAVHPHPEAVTDEAFVAARDFFDARDLVQVKYEMLRRVRQEGQTVTRAAAAFGFSRPSFYQAQKAFQSGGLPGLCPQRPGPRRAHKMSAEVLAFLEQEMASAPPPKSRDLAHRVGERFGVSVHPRSIERSLARWGKKRPVQKE